MTANDETLDKILGKGSTGKLSVEDNETIGAKAISLQPGVEDPEIVESYESARHFDMQEVIDRFHTNYMFTPAALSCYERGDDVRTIIVAGNSIALKFGIDSTTQNDVGFCYNGGKIDVTFYGWRPVDALALFRSTQSDNPVLIWLSQTIWQEFSGGREPDYIQANTQILPGELYPALEALMQHYDSKYPLDAQQHNLEEQKQS